MDRRNRQNYFSETQISIPQVHLASQIQQHEESLPSTSHANEDTGFQGIVSFNSRMQSEGFDPDATQVITSFSNILTA